MKNAFRYLSAFGIIVCLAVGCSESLSTPTSPSGAAPTAPAALTVDQLGGTWNLVSIQPTGQGVQLTPVGANYTLSFASGRLSTKADCNSCSAAFTLSGQTLTAGPAMACTRAACPTMAFETVYTSLLSGESTATVSARTLVLSSDRGLLHFAQ
jgi:heat shock protein HslJ